MEQLAGRVQRPGEGGSSKSRELPSVLTLGTLGAGVGVCFREAAGVLGKLETRGWKVMGSFIFQVGVARATGQIFCCLHKGRSSRHPDSAVSMDL